MCGGLCEWVRAFVCGSVWHKVLAAVEPAHRPLAPAAQRPQLPASQSLRAFLQLPPSVCPTHSLTAAHLSVLPLPLLAVGAAGCCAGHPSLQLPRQPGCVQAGSCTHGRKHSRAQTTQPGRHSGLFHFVSFCSLCFATKQLCVTSYSFHDTRNNAHHMTCAHFV